VLLDFSMPGLTLAPATPMTLAHIVLLGSHPIGRFPREFLVSTTRPPAEKALAPQENPIPSAIGDFPVAAQLAFGVFYERKEWTRIG
jgi:hypothetical protein